MLMRTRYDTDLCVPRNFIFDDKPGKYDIEDPLPRTYDYDFPYYDVDKKRTGPCKDPKSPTL
jgi:hypothetical protein